MSTRIRIAAVSAGPLVVLALATLAVYFVWLPRLPATMASHVGPDGRADDFVSTTAVPFTLPPLMLAMALFLGGTALTVHGPAQRILCAAGAASGGLLGVLSISVLAVNLDVSDPASVRFPAAMLGGAAAAAGAGGLLGWFGSKTGEPTAVEPAPARTPVHELAADEAVDWRRTVHSPPTRWIAIYFLPLAVIIAWVSTGWALLAVIPLYVLLTAFARAEVVVDDDGLTVRMLFGWWRVRVAAAEIREASSREIDAMRDFAGWGWRSTAAASGLIYRSGPGLWIDRRFTGKMAITVPDADEAAALLNGLRDRVSRG